MNKIKYIIVILIASSLYSCLGIKQFKSEDIKKDNTLRDTTFVAVDSVENFSWREVFTDPSLQALIEKGIANNPDLLIAAENVIQSQQYLSQSKWAYAPTINGVVTSGYNNLNSPTDQVFVGGNVSWEPDIWGKITAKKRSSINALMRDMSSVRAVQSAVVSNLASLYYQLLALDQQLAITKEFVELAKKTEQTVTVMRDNGMTNSAAVEQTRAQRFSAMASIPEIENAIYSLENAISLIIGENAGEIERADSYVDLNSEFLQQGFPFSMVSNRPDVKVAEYNLLQAFNLSQSAKAAMYPSIKFSLDIGSAGASMYNFYNPGNLLTNFLGSLTAPLLNGRALRTSYKVSQSKYRQLTISFENALRSAGSEVSESIYQYKNLTKQIELRGSEVAANEKAVDYTEQLLFNGKVTYLEVLTAQSNFLSSSLSLVDDKYNQQNTFISLYKSLGGGWE